MIGYWITLKSAGVKISLTELMGMGFRRTLSKELINAIIYDHVSELNIGHARLEAHFLAGGRVLDVVKGCTMLKRAQVPFEFMRVAAMDLAKGQVYEMISSYMSVKVTYPGLSFNEFCDRYIIEENLLEDVKQGKFVPWTDSSGWLLRAEYGPMKLKEIKNLINEGRVPKDSKILKPQGTVWLPLSSFEEVIRDV